MFCGKRDTYYLVLRAKKKAMLKSTKESLKKLEGLFKEGGYKVRYGKGNFHAGNCLLDEQKMIVVNKLYTLEAKMGILLQLLPSLDLKTDNLSSKNKTLLVELVPEKAALFQEEPETETPPQETEVLEAPDSLETSDETETTEASDDVEESDEAETTEVSDDVEESEDIF